MLPYSQNTRLSIRRGRIVCTGEWSIELCSIVFLNIFLLIISLVSLNLSNRLVGFGSVNLRACSPYLIFSSVQFRPVQFSSWQYFYSHISLFISVQFSSVQLSCFMPKRTGPKIWDPYIKCFYFMFWVKNKMYVLFGRMDWVLVGQAHVLGLKVFKILFYQLSNVWVCVGRVLGLG